MSTFTTFTTRETHDFSYKNILLLLLYIGYLAPLTNLAAQTEFSQREKDCSP